MIDGTTRWTSVLLLGPERPRMEEFLRAHGADVRRTEKKLKADSKILDGVDWIVSYGYRYILREDVLSRFSGRVVNLHISYLPWNRGADPNLWSFLEDTPKGVTIHYIDPGIDTGDILAQSEIDVRDNDTLRTTYARLSETIETLFERIWPEVVSGRRQGTQQSSGGTAHRMKDKEPYLHLLTDGWDTPVASLIGQAMVSQ